MLILRGRQRLSCPVSKKMIYVAELDKIRYAFPRRICVGCARCCCLPLWCRLYNLHYCQCSFRFYLCCLFFDCILLPLCLSYDNYELCGFYYTSFSRHCYMWIWCGSTDVNVCYLMFLWPQHMFRIVLTVSGRLDNQWKTPLVVSVPRQ